MEILNRQVSPFFDKFYSEITKNITKPILFCDISTHPVTSTRDFDGSCEENSEIKIWLNKNQSSDDFEISAAHEITHAVLRREGFPHTTRTQIYAKDEWVSNIGGRLGSSLSDLVIDARLKKSGFDVTQKHLKNIEGKQSQIRKEKEERGQPEPYGPRGCIWAIYYMSSEFGFHRQQRRRFQRTLQENFPEIAKIGDSLIEVVRINGFDKPEKMLKSLVGIRDKLSLQDKIKIIDSLNGTQF